MFTIRDFDYSDADYARMAAIDSACYPEYKLGEAFWRHLDANRDPALLFWREMIARDGQVMAYGEYGHLPWAYHPHKFWFLLSVDPAAESACEADDIRPGYFAHVQAALVPHAPIAMLSGALEDRTAQVDFLAAQGFEPVLREPLSILPVQAFDPAPFAAAAESVAAAGICILPLPAVQQRFPDDWQQRLYALYWAITEDVPSAGEQKPPPLQQFISAHLTGPDSDPAAWFIAIDETQAGDPFAGLSQADRDGDPGRLRGGLTGVLRSYRRRGIATALKLRLIDYARQCGAEELTTGNAEENPMYQINLRLGYVPRPAYVTFEKTIYAGQTGEKVEQPQS